MNEYIASYRDDEGNIVDQVTLTAPDEKTAYEIVARGLELKQITVTGSLIANYDVKLK